MDQRAMDAGRPLEVGGVETVVREDNRGVFAYVPDQSRGDPCRRETISFDSGAGPVRCSGVEMETQEEICLEGIREGDTVGDGQIEIVGSG